MNKSIEELAIDLTNATLPERIQLARGWEQSIRNDELVRAINAFERSRHMFWAYLDQRTIELATLNNQTKESK